MAGRKQGTLAHTKSLLADSVVCLQSIKDVTVPEGTLKIVIVEAEHIPKGDYIQDASPYVE